MVVSPPKNSADIRQDIRHKTAAWRYRAGWALINAGYFRIGDELQSCSDPDRAWQAKVCPDGHEEAYQKVVPTCHLPYCPMCGHARSADLARQYTPIVQDALNASPDDHELRHITLTTPFMATDPDIEQKAALIWNKAIRCLELVLGYKQRQWKAKDLGVLGGWEFGGDGLKLHIHLEVLSPWIDAFELTNCWKFITGGVCRITKIKKVRGVEAGTREVTKYATKLTELSPALVPALHRVLSGKRRIRAYGAFSCKIADAPCEPMACPVCGQALVLESLLNLRPGNNFAQGEANNPAKVPQLASIPPPTQLEFPDLAFRRSETYNLFDIGG